MLDDIILIKADGYPTYNFAHIVDDLEMGVTHVMRGEEFISSTPKFLSLYDALEVERPIFVTLPSIMGPDGKKKLSKRDGVKDLLDYRDDGYLPEAMKNFLALIGWNPGGDQELYSTDDLIKTFSIDKIQKSGGAFNEEKLRWMNKEYLKKLPTSDKIDYVSKAGVDIAQLNPGQQELFTEIIMERVSNQAEISHAYEAGEYDWLSNATPYDSNLLKWKHDESAKDALPRLEQVADLLQSADFSSPESIKEVLWNYAEEEGKGEVLWPLRVALSGQERSPDPFSIAFIVGRTETLVRIKNACDKIKG